MIILKDDKKSKRKIRKWEQIPIVLKKEIGYK